MFTAMDTAMRKICRAIALMASFVGIVTAVLPQETQAIPLFARQTGQNCVACHAGGQYPELTAYGRKLFGRENQIDIV